MKVASSREMQEIDRKAQTEYTLSGDVLMERAALAALDVMRRTAGPLEGKRVCVCCGKGNNGGDGLALARLLQEEGARVWVALAFEPAGYSGLAGLNLQRAKKWKVPVCSWDEMDRDVLKEMDLMVDALLGTGTRGEPGESLIPIIRAFNEAAKPIYALDLPSGVAVDTGQVVKSAIRATYTITLGLPKPGLLLYPGAEYAGEVVVASIGFPRDLLQSSDMTVNMLTGSDIRPWLPARSPNAHKGTQGHLLVIGGSPGMTGAVTLTALAALRSGCGLVTVGLRDQLMAMEKPAEVITSPWSGLAGRWNNYRAMVIGPGMSVAADGEELLNRILDETDAPLVIDADALNILARHPEYWSRMDRPVVVTPHPGEMARLTGWEIPKLQADRLDAARRFAKQWGVTVVLKGAHTVIAFPEGELYINTTGNSGMATAGMGDALAGMIGGLVAQGVSVPRAAVVGTYIHGLAGDLAARELGPVGIIAGDLVERIPGALRQAALGTERNETQANLYFIKKRSQDVEQIW